MASNNSEKHEREKRKFPRLDAKYLVSFEYFDDEFAEDSEGLGLSQNLSLGGIRIEMDKKVRQGAVLFMEIALRDNLIKATGRIAHAKKLANGKMEVGISFTDIEPEALDALMKFFKEKGLSPLSS